VLLHPQCPWRGRVLWWEGASTVRSCSGRCGRPSWLPIDIDGRIRGMRPALCTNLPSLLSQPLVAATQPYLAGLVSARLCGVTIRPLTSILIRFWRRMMCTSPRHLHSHLAGIEQSKRLKSPKRKNVVPNSSQLFDSVTLGPDFDQAPLSLQLCCIKINL